MHTTQFAIRERGLYEPVLRIAAEAAAEQARPPILVAGAIGRTAQAVAEAQIARGLGYHAVLLSLAAWKGASEDEMIAHCQAVAAEMPLFGFYLQPAVGGVPLSAAFWRRFAAIENVVAIKIAPFNRYATLDVLRGVLEAGAQDRIALYTGNDDHIVADLLTPFTLVHRRRADHAADRGRAARPLVASGRARRWSCRQRCAAVTRRHPGRPAGARRRGHRDERRRLRRGARLPRRHRRLPRSAAPAGAAGRHLVPRSNTKRSRPARPIC